MKKYKYTQLLEISLGLALEKIGRLENSKHPLIPAKDPEIKVPDFTQDPDYTRIWNRNDLSPTGFRVHYGKAGKVSIPNEHEYPYCNDPEGLNLTPKGFTAGPLEVVISSHIPSGIQWNPAPGEQDVDLEELRELEKQTNWERLQKGLEEARVRTSEWSGQDKPRAVRELVKQEPKAAPYNQKVAKAIFEETLKNTPPLPDMVKALLFQLQLGKAEFAKLLGVDRRCIYSWMQSPRVNYNRPLALKDLVALYYEHFPKQETFEETLVPFVKGEDDIILQKPLKENPVVYPASTKRPPRLLNHNDQVTRLQLSQRSLNALERAHIVTVGDLIGYTETALKKLKGLGNKSFKEVVNAALKAGFRFTRLH